ncbi:hypothetical protein ZIOFF_062790 [Zingiber officinale]|uniref:Endoplasmic reticulum vesicle transporter C-terminal domain-containing protein n=1 Tax=Zingiber officinale TaxID=94328 RepID=A0A8J5F5U5_ZINOF|nr:hypothetical protein ZIOFF_062790 [Zingiber officinale]
MAALVKRGGDPSSILVCLAYFLVFSWRKSVGSGGVEKVNVSHVIHDLSFGPKYPGIHNPLGGIARILDDTSGTFKNYIKIVPTEYIYLSKEVLPTNQFSITEYFVPMRDFDRSWPGQCLKRHTDLTYK